MTKFVNEKSVGPAEEEIVQDHGDTKKVNLKDEEIKMKEEFNSGNNSTFSSAEKDKLYKDFVRDFDKIGDNLRAELESHLDPDKGGDLLDEEFFKKILKNSDDKLDKLRENFSEKVNKIYDEKQKINAQGDSGVTAETVAKSAAVAVATATIVSTVTVTTTTFFGIPIFSSTLAAIIGGATGLATGIVTAGLGAAAGVGVGVAIHKMGKKTRRLKLIEKSMEAFEDVRKKCLEWANELLDR